MPALRRSNGSPSTALLRGSLVEMRRTCGKKGCRCQQGQKHPALCLAIRWGGQRKMIYIPHALEETVRRWVERSPNTITVAWSAI